MTIRDAKSYLRGKYTGHGLTQEQVALDVLHIDPATLSRYMNGTTQWPLWVIQTLMDYFGILPGDVYSVFISPFVGK